MSKISQAIADWLDSQEDKDQTIMASCGGRYTATDLIREIEDESEVGKKLEDDITKLTIDLLFRKREKL